MFWTLLLAHLIADYPLQNDSMVRAKRQWRGLAVHVLFHLVAMGVLLIQEVWQVWPQLLALTAMHFAIDSLKNFLALRRPKWIIGPYLGDQVLHLVSLVLIAQWIQQVDAHGDLWLTPMWAVVISGYLLTTYIWAISERVFVYANPSYLEEVQSMFWERILIRGGLLTLILLIAGPLADLVRRQRQGTEGVAALLRWPYGTDQLGRRALYTDLAAVVGGALFILVASSLASVGAPF